MHRDDVDRRPPGLVGSDIDRVLAGFGAPPAPVLTRVDDVWGDLVGPAAADHCRPGRVVEGKLHIEVDDPAWASQMRWQQAAVIARIAEIVPGAQITSLVVHVRPRH